MNNYASDYESETLEEIKFTYKPPASPIPQRTRVLAPSSDSDDSRTSTLSRRSRNSIPKKKPVKRRKSKGIAGQGDHVLLRSFAPNNPELNKSFGSRTFDLGSSDDSDFEPLMEGGVRVAVPGPTSDYSRDAGQSQAGFPSGVSAEAVSVVASTVSATSALMQRYCDEGRGPLPPLNTGNASLRRSHSNMFDSDRRRPSLPMPAMSPGQDSDANNRMRDAVAVDGLMKLSGESPRQRSTVREIVTTSHMLQPHMISRSQGALGQTLPAITDPSPSVETMATPNPDVSLPSIKELTGEGRATRERPRSGSFESTVAERPRAASYSSVSTLPNLSPTANHRVLPPPLQSPYHAVPMSRTSTLSSRGPGSPRENYIEHARDRSRQPSVNWSSNPRRVAARSVDAIPPFLSARGKYSSSSGATSSSATSSSVNTSQSTASTTSTNTEPYSPSSNSTEAGTPHSSVGARQSGTYPHYPNYPSVAVAGYKCQHEGCDAAPFATQYLLNSHANVHSQERPHYCPEPRCPRSKGGKGFKRKNEMIRHGLVHKSPGYVCPWCPDREHKYPRPDNLQRHVRMHHDDKDKHDPKLLQVLALRTASGSGRRVKKRS